MDYNSFLLKPLGNLARWFFLYSFLLITGIMYSQEETIGTITHYQNKLKTDHLIVPLEHYNDQDFVIGIPKDIYNNGSISVKKFQVDKIKFRTKLIFEQDQYIIAQYTVKNRKKDVFIELLKTQLNISDINSGECIEKHGFKISVTSGSRYHVFTLTIEE